MLEIACDWRPVTRVARSRRMPRLTSSPPTARQPWVYLVILPAPFSPVTFANKITEIWCLSCRMRSVLSLTVATLNCPPLLASPRQPCNSPVRARL